MTKATTATRNENGEEGFVLLGVLFLVVVMLIWLAVAAPKVATEIRRDKELELYHRGMQYTRAIRLYYKKSGAYPIPLDRLENTNNIRFLRKRYNDPFTGKPDWRLIHVGEARLPQNGLFGQPAGVAGAGNTSGFINNGGQSNSGSGISGSTLGGSSSSNNNFSGGSSSGSDPSSGSGSGGAGTGTGTSGSGFGSNGSGTGGPTGLGGSTLTSSSGSPIGSTGPIVGVASSVKKESIREYQKQKHYNEWEFVYNPQADLGGLGGNTGQGVLQQGGTANNPLGGSSSSGGLPGSSGSQQNPGQNPGSPANPNPPSTPPAGNPPADPNNPSQPTPN